MVFILTFYNTFTAYRRIPLFLYKVQLLLLFTDNTFLLFQ